MNSDLIKNIEKLIQVDRGTTILGYDVRPLTAPGENYGSLMLAVDLKVKTRSGEQKIHTVAKLVPPNELIQEIFNTQTTFRNEIAFYKKIVPTLQNFQRDNGIREVINFACKCYGGRVNLSGDDGKVDENAALVLENLKVQNFTTLERTAGLDLDATRLVLKNLAHLHGVALALKLKTPEIFKKQVRPYLDPWYQKKQIVEQSKKDTLRILEKLSEFKSLQDRVLKGYDEILIKYEPREPFATISHNDCWTNNNMFKLEGTKPIKSVLVDYQVCSYGSPARDFIFFLFSSVKNNIIEEKYEELITEYHQSLISILKELKCDTKPFSFEAFKKEIDVEAKQSQFGHVMFMLFPIYIAHDKAKEVSELTMESLQTSEPTEELKEKIAFVVKQFAKRNWI